MTGICCMFAALLAQCRVLIYIGLFGSFLLGAGASFAHAQSLCPPPVEAAAWQASQPCEPHQTPERSPIALRTPLPDQVRWLNRQLVGTTPKGEFRFAIAPHVVDLTGSSLIALNLRFRYGITTNWMVGFRLRTYTDNPFTDDERSDPGIGDILFETKYRLPAWRALRLQSAIGLKVLVPLTNNENRSDGVIHVAPGLTLMRPLTSWLPLHLYNRVGIDFATGDIVRTPVADEIQETFFLWAWGLVYTVPSAHLFFDVAWQTNVFIKGGDRHNLLITPGIRYELPKLSWLPGLWTIEFGLRIGLVDTQDRYDLGFRITLDRPKRKPQRSGRQSFRAPASFMPGHVNMASLAGSPIPGFRSVTRGEGF